VKRFLCKRLPRPCPNGGGGADLYDGVQYQWIFHHDPELIVYKGSSVVKRQQLAALNEQGLHELFSKYFPKVAGGRRLLGKNATAHSQRHLLRLAHDAGAHKDGNVRAPAEPRQATTRSDGPLEMLTSKTGRMMALLPLMLIALLAAALTRRRWHAQLEAVA
jgi:hypothetical protein